MDNNFELNGEDLILQIKARNVIKRDTIILLIAMLVFLILFVAFAIRPLHWGNLPPYFGMVLMLGFMIAIRSVSVWHQWVVLIQFGLKCPYCRKPLAEKVNCVVSPSHFCPHCGRVALSPIKYLRDAEKQSKSTPQPPV